MKMTSKSDIEYQQLKDEILSDFLNEDISNSNPLRILILEDSPSDAELISYNLGDLQIPYIIEHVFDKKEFQAKFAIRFPHLIISDYQLPQYTGKEALVFVREMCGFLPFIMCTGRINEETAVECIKLGADDYVLKDDLVRLPSAVKSALTLKTNKAQKDKLNLDLAKSEANLRAIINNSPSNIYTIDKEGLIIYSTKSRMNSSVSEGTSVFDHTHPKNHDIIRKNINLSYKLKQDVEFEIEGSENLPFYDWYRCKMGPIIKDGEVDKLVFIPHLITDIRKANVELKSVNDRLNQLNSHLENVRDEEKKKIAMEIHDQLGQELIGSKLGLYWLKQNLKGDLGQKSNELNQKVDDLIELSTQVINTTRRIAYELRPVVLDDLGLLAALEWHIANYNKFRETICELKLNCDVEEFEKEISTAIYRIVQEALTNIDKHAKASHALIKLKRHQNKVELTITDNGKGLDVQKALNSKSMGIFGMQERIKNWDGDFVLSSSPEGTEMKISIKLTKK
jgi:two-component system sensor histidine kinase UhpB